MTLWNSEASFSARQMKMPEPYGSSLLSVNGLDASRSEPIARPFSRIVVLITEDWFVLSHFRPLLAALKECAREIVVVTRCTGRLAEIQALGVRTIAFDYRRSSINPLDAASSVRALASILRVESSEVVHMVALKPMILGSLSLNLMQVPHVVAHVTGFGLLSITRNPLLRLYWKAALALIASVVRKPSSHVLVENLDDLKVLREAGGEPGARYTLLNGGAGVAPDAFSPLPTPDNEIPVAAYVGRMIRSKGVDLLMDAYDRLETRGKGLRLALYGDSDPGNREAIPPQVLHNWCARSGGLWHGHVADVREIWRRADMLVMPSRGGEGMPRALLEAAACGRPLIVTDVSGSRDFVRDGFEGLVVPPRDPAALADALARLASDRNQREQMGKAARTRFLDGFQEDHVKRSLRTAYHSLRAAEH